MIYIIDIHNNKIGSAPICTYADNSKCPQCNKQ